MKNKILEILVVEDDAKHLADAKAETQKITDSGLSIKADYATNLAEAIKCLESKKYDGIISDIFFPSGMEDEYDMIQNVAKIIEDSYGEYKSDLKKDREIADAMALWKTLNDLAPLGVHIAENYKDVPLVFCTDTFHHGFKTQPVFNYAGKRNIIIVDYYPMNMDGNMMRKSNVKAVTKDWEGAYGSLIKLIEKQKK